MKNRAPNGLEVFPLWIWSGGKMEETFRLKSKHPNEALDQNQFFTFDSLAERLSETNDIPRVTVRIEEAGQEAEKAARELFTRRKFWKVGSIEVLKGGFGTLVPAVELFNVETSRCDLSGRKVSIEDCTIADLKIFAHDEVCIRRCHIGCLSISTANEVKSLTLRLDGGRVVQLTLNQLENFREIRLEGEMETKFSDRTKRYFSSEIGDAADVVRLDRVSFAALHDWALKKGHSRLAHVARGYELAIEKAESPWNERIFLSLWGMFANYGRSLWRPFGVLLVLMASFVVLLYQTGTSLGVNPETLSGWQTALIGEDQSAVLHRSVAGAVEGVFSPFNVLSSRRLVVPDTAWVAIIQFFYSYACVTLLFLFGFSVRRRFKVG